MRLDTFKGAPPIASRIAILAAAPLPVAAQTGPAYTAPPQPAPATPAAPAANPAPTPPPDTASASTTPAGVNPPATATGASTVSGAPAVTITDPSENQNVSTRSGDHTIMGNVSESGASVSSDIDRIEIWIDGERNSGTLLGTVTPASDGSWSQSFTPTHFASTHSNIYVYAHSRSTGRETETVRGFNITDQ